jgi:hypothetical protein
VKTVRCAVIIIAASKPRGGGWTSPDPGVLVWHTAAGRIYTTTPTRYAT